MKLRYYLRGVGTGILVAALILGRLIGSSRPLTDAEIRAKALMLGMVDPNSLSLSDVGGDGGAASLPEESSGSSGNENNDPDTDTQITDSPEPEDSPSPETSSAPTSVVSPSPSPSPETSSAPTSVVSPSPSPATEESPGPDPESVETVTLMISRGDSSYSVCRHLEELGLIEDAREYDTYLVDHGYSKTIRTGTYQIPVGADWEEIAKIIS